MKLFSRALISSCFSITFLTGLILLSACGKADQAGKSSLGSPGTGCVQGVLVNGLTGERIRVPTPKAGQGVNVLVRDSLVGGGALAGYDANANPALIGQYVACGVPLDEDFAVFANIDGYMAFDGLIKIESTAPSKSPAATTHLFKGAPTREANIILYPQGTQTNDLRFVVSYNGTPMKGAFVQLKPTGRNALDGLEAAGTANNIIQPRDLRLNPLSGIAGDDGAVVFAKGDLVLGGIYKYVVVGPDNGATTTTAIDTTGSVIVGLHTGKTTDPYTVNVVLAPAVPDLALVSISTASEDFNPNGDLRMVFNRPVELVPNSLDGVKAWISSGALYAEIVPDVPGNFKTETVKVQVNGNIVTLTPIFKTQPDPLKEPGLQVSFAGLRVRAADSPSTLKVITVDSQTVKLFGSDPTPSLVAWRMDKAGDGQKAVAGTFLPTPLTVTVYDQYTTLLRNQAVVFTVTTGGGSVKKSTDIGTGSSSITVITDSQGVASVIWALGTYQGTQTVQAKAGNLEAVTFTAEGTP